MHLCCVYKCEHVHTYISMPVFVHAHFRGYYVCGHMICAQVPVVVCVCVCASCVFSVGICVSARVRACAYAHTFEF